MPAHCLAHMSHAAYLMDQVCLFFFCVEPTLCVAYGQPSAMSQDDLVAVAAVDFADDVVVCAKISCTLWAFMDANTRWSLQSASAMIHSDLRWYCCGLPEVPESSDSDSDPAKVPVRAG